MNEQLMKDAFGFDDEEKIEKVPVKKIGWFSRKLYTLKTYTRRWLNALPCPRCCGNSPVTNEIFDNSGKQIGWERECSWCNLHWREINCMAEYLDRASNTWKKDYSSHKE